MWLKSYVKCELVSDRCHCQLVVHLCLIITSGGSGPLVMLKAGGLTWTSEAGTSRGRGRMKLWTCCQLRTILNAYLLMPFVYFHYLWCPLLVMFFFSSMSWVYFSRVAAFLLSLSRNIENLPHFLHPVKGQKVVSYSWCIVAPINIWYISPIVHRSF